MKGWQAERYMPFTTTHLYGVWVIDPQPVEDVRGQFMRVWCAREFREHGIEFQTVQANTARSIRKGTIRGMHFQQEPDLEAKLVRCTRGSIFDVALDLRPESATFGRWYGVELDAESGRMLYVPEQCAHGFQTLEDHTELHYMASAAYSPGSARGARFDDPAFNITWPLPVTVISEQDRNWPLTQPRRTQ
jgi:dTDP-4-dehydrorhamnose 3,5-epimerase